MSSKYLTYYDADVDLEDVELFEDGRWLNDKCIDLFIEYLDHNITSKDDISRSKVFLLRAALTFLISNIQGVLSYITFIFIASLLYDQFLSKSSIFTAQVIFMIVNDNNDVTKARGGNHWSLLIFIRKTNKFLHYDSANGMNTEAAKSNAVRIAGVLGVTGSSFHNMKTPLQENAFNFNNFVFKPHIKECGIYVISITEQLYRKVIKYYQTHDHDDEIELSSVFELDNDQIPIGREMRKRCRNIVKDLRNATTQK
ncbi:5545_t:CDS:2 [Scutellospora calospora]|uniref:5545_t:CDS:1 n=1 Tax=Scutellospora calospora TaxID=85575 RepID=A0ACA9KN40_9GLOM|nr:5545_t:CDS:2 [Scutellospora calospora]